MAKPKEIHDRLEAVERLAFLFRYERYAYLAITVISFIILCAIAVRMLMQNTAQIPEWGLLFGSSGLITITANQVLQFWLKSLRLVASSPIDGSTKEVGHG